MAGAGTRAATDAPGALLGHGRTADVYDLGDGRALRRYRVDFDHTDEIAVMRYLNLRGFPAPRLYKADGGRDMELERIDGPTMLKALVRKPWRTAHYARTLADLHRRLHEVPHVDPTPHISDACRAKLDDANMRPVERERLRYGRGREYEH